MEHRNSSDNSYVRLLVRGLLRATEDDFAHFCIENGASGIAEDLPYTQVELVYDPKIVETTHCDVNVYFVVPPAADFLTRLQREFPGIKVELHTEANQDWMENWKKGFEPFLFCEPFWIVPSWREVPPEAKQYLFVDPGMAFGTGTHETTRLAARQLIDSWSSFGDKPDVLDVGTGTGVLALIAQRLGAGRVVGIDNDPEARRVARENIVLNGSAAIEIPETQLDELKHDQYAVFDVVVANIIDGVLLTLKDQLLRVLKPGGTLILSGILTDREGPFLDEFLAGTNLRNRRRRTMGEWSSFLVR